MQKPLVMTSAGQIYQANMGKYFRVLNRSILKQCLFTFSFQGGFKLKIDTIQTFEAALRAIAPAPGAIPERRSEIFVGAISGAALRKTAGARAEAALLK